MDTVSDINVNIKELRCSLAWISLFTKPSALRNQNDYRGAFKKAASDNNGKWALPWLENPPVIFWEKYLETELSGSEPPKDNKGANEFVLDPEKARRCVVPLRTRGKDLVGEIDLKGQATNEVVNSWIEGFVYPHGVACIITWRWRSKGGLALDKMVDRLIELRNAKFSWSHPIPTVDDGKEKTLNEISKNALNYLSSAIGGGDLRNVNSDPYTIVTIVEAENAPLAGEPAEGEMLHRFLDALCALNPKWRCIKPSALKDALLATKGGVQDDVLYARGLGRVIWLPGYFRQHWQSSQPHATNKRKFIRYLGRYHRNLTLATMQTAYLSIFLKWVNTLVNAMGNDDLAWEGAAAGAVGRLYGKCKKSYMSSSLPHQIVMGHFLNPINASRGNRLNGGRKLGEEKKPDSFKKYGS